MKRICDHCDKQFYSNRPKQRFCGYKCRALDYHFNNREKRIAYMKKKRDAGYSVWANIKRRCSNPDDRSYSCYGAKGIRCEFESFEELQKVLFRSDQCELCDCVLDDIDKLHGKGRCLDRIDSSGPYSPENTRPICRSCNSKEANAARKRGRLLAVSERGGARGRQHEQGYRAGGECRF